MARALSGIDLAACVILYVSNSAGRLPFGYCAGSSTRTFFFVEENDPDLKVYSALGFMHEDHMTQCASLQDAVEKAAHHMHKLLNDY